MTIPYYEPFNGKRPIVDRVPECRVEVDPRHFINSVPDYIAAALTRDAIKCWVCGYYAGVAIGHEHAIPLAETLLGMIDHAEVNAAAHALADTLEIAP